MPRALASAPTTEHQPTVMHSGAGYDLDSAADFLQRAVAAMTSRDSSEPLGASWYFSAELPSIFTLISFNTGVSPLE